MYIDAPISSANVDPDSLSLITSQPSEATPLTKKKNLNLYSPTTGTRQISPFSSPTSRNARDLRNGLSNDLPGDGNKQNELEIRLSRRGQCQAEKDAFAELQSKVKSSLVRFLKTRASLTNLQALEGSRELENIIGVSDLSCVLSAEVQKTQVLMGQAEELQLLERNHGKLPAQEYARAADSAAFFRLLLDSQ
uniref:Integrin subunit beta 3 binding protein n=1 Tax=Anas platyrhynchos platyrhynchos TaxID=8840 RepID=A0A493TT95_ANAPP